ISDCVYESLFKVDSRLPTQDPSGAADIGLAYAGIIDRQWFVFNHTSARCQLDHFMSQLDDREFTRVADVCRQMDIDVAVWGFTLGLRRASVGSHQQPHDSVDQVAHVGEGPRLSAVSIDTKRLPFQRLNDKVRHDAAIIWTHSGAVRIEYPHEPRIQPMIPVISHRHRLAESLGFVVYTTRPHRIYVTPVFFGLRVNLRITIDLGGRRQEETRALRFRQTQRLVSPQA